jgi:hypothetical protein
MKITKEEAIHEINNIINQIPNVANSGRNSTEHVRWLFNCNNILEKVFGKRSTFFVSFASLKWRETGSYVVQSWDIQGAIEERHYRAFLQCLEMARGIFLSAIDEIERTNDISDVYKDKIEDEGNVLIKLLNIINNKFRKFFRDEPNNEKDVQNLFENLLIASDFSYSREKEHILYSSKTYIPDFILNDLNMAVEIKICNRNTREKEIISEINDDILAYSTKFKNIMFLVYDIGQIRDVELFKSSFASYENVVVVIIKH